MKRLILTLASIAIMGCATTLKTISKPTTQEEIFSKLGIPEKFIDYRGKAWISESMGIYNNETIYFANYDLDGDGRADVTEVRDNLNEYPSEIGFDVNGNHFFEEEEIWLDLNKDNWNGNETSFYAAKRGVSNCEI